MTEPSWLREPPSPAYAAVLDAAELAARHQPEGARRHLAVAAHETDARWLANAGVRTLARLVGGPHASAWWRRLREEVNTYTDPAEALTVVANMEVLAVAEAMERGAFGRVDELTCESQFDPVDYAAISARFVGLIVAHHEVEGICPVSEMLARLRRACGLQDGAA